MLGVTAYWPMACDCGCGCAALGDADRDPGWHVSRGDADHDGPDDGCRVTPLTDSGDLSDGVGDNTVCPDCAAGRHQNTTPRKDRT